MSTGSKSSNITEIPAAWGIKYLQRVSWTILCSRNVFIYSAGVRIKQANIKQADF